MIIVLTQGGPRIGDLKTVGGKVYRLVEGPPGEPDLLGGYRNRTGKLTGQWVYVGQESKEFPACEE